MEQALRALNALVVDGVLTDYAIGGAVGATFYLEALQTEDLDAFVFLPLRSMGLVLLGPVYEAFIAQGGVPERDYVRFGDWPADSHGFQSADRGGDSDGDADHLRRGSYKSVSS